MVQAVGISNISDGIADTNISKTSRAFGIPINLLIGINHPCFHVGETKIKDGLVVRRSPLHWVAFGVDNEQRVGADVWPTGCLTPNPLK